MPPTDINLNASRFDMSQNGQLPRMLLLSDPTGATSSTTSTGSVLDRIKQFLPEIASANERLATEGNASEATDCGITVERVGALDSDDTDDGSSSSDEDATSEGDDAEEDDLNDSDEEHGHPAEVSNAFPIFMVAEARCQTVSFPSSSDFPSRYGPKRMSELVFTLRPFDLQSPTSQCNHCRF